MNVSVIVTKCAGGTIFGERLVDERFPNVDEAKALGNTKIAAGMSVLVRPNYNETDADGTFYREWRSFNGEDFREVRFGTGW